MKQGPQNADIPTFSELMSDPEYLTQSFLRRKVLTQAQSDAKAMMGIKQVKRSPEHLDFAGFAEGALSADENTPPRMNVNKNPRFAK